ncbi:MAG TPA: FHA domain-containing protein [Telluria sp.]|nr:FHA domain-containing protein [Telluria sp.]
MAKIIISCEGLPPREVELGADRMTIGRHPHNDIVIDHPTVSSRHAAITLIGDHALLEDLGSTNGTYIGGKRVERHKLADRARALLAACNLDFVAGVTAAPGAQPVARPTPAPSANPAPQAAAPGAPPQANPAVSAPKAASIVVRSGVNAGRELPLNKPLTTLGSPGVLVVVIAKQAMGYTLTHVEGGTRPIVNGVQLGKDPVPLKDQDLIDLAGTTMSFLVSG